MTKTLLCALVILFLFSCNHTAAPKPDADRVIRDTVAQTILHPFMEGPVTKAIYAKVETRQDKFLCPRNASIKKLMADLKAAPQKFTINGKLENQITGAQGTKLLFTPNCFIKAGGGEIDEPITVELKECYSTEAMLNENLATTTSKESYYSKGLIYINALAGNEALKLREDANIEVQWPFAKNLNGYCLQYGKPNADDQVDWMRIENQKAKVFASSGFTKPEFNGQGLGFKNYLLQNISYPDEAKRNELSAKVEVTFTIDARGLVSNVNSAESYKVFRQAIDESLKKMPPWQPAVYHGKNIASTVHLSFDFNIRRAEQVAVEFAEDKAALVSEGSSIYLLYGSDLKRSPDNEKAGQTLDQLGWYNLSKALTPRRQPTAELIVCANEKSEIRLLMKKQHTILSGENNIGFADFKDLPLGESACVIGVKYEDGSMFYSIQPITINKQSVINLNWKKGSRQELLQVYHRLANELPG